jgi:hypothetical protein
MAVIQPSSAGPNRKPPNDHHTGVNLLINPSVPVGFFNNSTTFSASTSYLTLSRLGGDWR